MKLTGLYLTVAAVVSVAFASDALGTTFKDVPVMGSAPLVKQASNTFNFKPLKDVQPAKEQGIELADASETPLVFDIPVTYNKAVKFWITYFQTSGRPYFKSWLERSSRYMPEIQDELQRARLPQDLAYLAMIESGFSSHAVSNASAVGLWQFMQPTGHRYGLRTDWWLDERRDPAKSTRAAIGYISDLYRLFGSWYMVAASYNMGEGGLKRLVNRYQTNNFWQLADMGVLPKETRNYVPKIIAAMLISKAPGLYGFRDLDYHSPEAYDSFNAPGGTDIGLLANSLGVSPRYLRDLNPELIRGFIPRGVGSYRIRVPRGSLHTAKRMAKAQTDGTGSIYSSLDLQRQ